jgi:NAD(P)-dependent dehydrogenase (short-subunit alcohol dehydrogenase family)
MQGFWANPRPYLIVRIFTQTIKPQKSLMFYMSVSDEDFDSTMAINCKGVLYCYREAAVQIIKPGKGERFVGASSMIGQQGGLLAYIHPRSCLMHS